MNRSWMLWLWPALVLTGLILAASCGAPSEPPDGRLRVLLIGDSISIEYAPIVAELLQESALVVHNPGNAQHTVTGRSEIDAWLGDGNWDVIHFNWGLWDLCYRKPSRRKFGDRNKIEGTAMVSLEDYRDNLEALVVRLQQTGAALIWAHTTVVPKGEPGRFVGDDLKYNEAAARVMARHGIPINDLNGLTRTFESSLFRAPGDVHFAPEGYRRIAEQVATAIVEVLPEEEASP